MDNQSQGREDWIAALCFVVSAEAQTTISSEDVTERYRNSSQPEG